jgi:hypothetical protein
LRAIVYSKRSPLNVQFISRPTILEAEKVRLQYSRVIFALDLPVCPKCGMVLIDEKLAEAEQAIEDK